MQKTGKVNRIHFGKTYCFLTVEGEPDYFLHKNDLQNPEEMKEGRLVKFTPTKGRPGAKNPSAVEAVIVAA